MNAENNTMTAIYITLIIAIGMSIIQLLTFVALVTEINKYNVIILVMTLITTGILTIITIAILSIIYALFGIRNTLKDIRKGLTKNRNKHNLINRKV